MGKPTGFMEYQRKDPLAEAPEERVGHFREFKKHLKPEELQLQGARCMACGIPFCQSGELLAGMTSGCPLHNLVPETNDLVYRGRWKQAYERLKKTNCFPEFTGRVCPALCEAACTCGLDGEAVATKENERAIIEKAFEEGWEQPEPPKTRTGKKIAVVGSGPAGLAAALLLNRRGHWVTVLERSDRPGGLLRYGIPNMKLEKSVVDRRIRLMEEEGVVFRCGADVGKNVSAEELKQEFDCVLLACGASRPRDIGAEGRDAEGIWFAVDFLGKVTKTLLDGKKPPYELAEGKHVLVVGGGDTGNDCVGTVLRLKAASVLQLEMMPKPPACRTAENPWPEWPKILKTDYGQEEAAALFGKDPRVYQKTVKKFIRNKSGHVKAAELVSLKPEKDPETGRIRMEPVPGSEETVPADLVLIAAGFLGSEEYPAEAFGLRLDSRGRAAGASGYETESPGVFTAGDMRRGQSLVVWAVREGREAAREIDRKLMGYSNL